MLSGLVRSACGVAIILCFAAQSLAITSFRVARGSDWTAERARIAEVDATRATGDYAAARAISAELVKDLLGREPLSHDPQWLLVLEDAGRAAFNSEDVRTANAAWQRVHDVRASTLPDEHPHLQVVRGNLSVTFRLLGDLRGARALEEKALAVCERTLPADHPDLQASRENLAGILQAMGEVPSARALLEQVLEVRARTLPDDDPAVLKAKVNLAGALHAQGDFAAARELDEQVLQVRSRTLPDDHPDLQSARLNFAATLDSLGEKKAARTLFERVLAVWSRTLPDDHPNLQRLRGNLANVCASLGDFAGARALEEKVLAAFAQTLPDDHPDLLRARLNLASTLAALGDAAGARALDEEVVEVRSRTLPADHPELQRARANLALSIVWELAIDRDSTESQREQCTARCAELIRAVCQSQVDAARTAVLSSSAREAEERCAGMQRSLNAALSFAEGLHDVGPLAELAESAFVLSETTRSAGIAAARFVRAARAAPEYEARRYALRAASEELAALARAGTSSAAFDRARTKRDAAERQLVELARARMLGPYEAFQPDALVKELGLGEATVAYRRYTRYTLQVTEGVSPAGKPSVREVLVESLCAFVLRGASTDEGERSPTAMPLTLVDLGPIEPIQRAVREWRASLGVADDVRGVAAGAHSSADRDQRSLGADLRTRVLDPLMPALGDVTRLVVVPDDALHLVPFDSLPLDAARANVGEANPLVGDRWQIETRVTLAELLHSQEPARVPGRLVALGDIEYAAVEATGERVPDSGASGLASSIADQAPRPEEVTVALLRGSRWSDGFTALPATGPEVRGIARLYAERADGERDAEVRLRGDATRIELEALAPSARYLHVATHGWFAPDSIASWGDPEPLDQHARFASRSTGEEQVERMSPMLLCGLALAGANSRSQKSARAGLITADELSTLDLSNCELAVLSACDTSAGIVRAGQGVASLQKALHMAGARSVVTSLWKVPDEATKELMLDFYRRLWVEKKPKWRALWEAKKMLREAENSLGQPKYATHDWAAWVLTGAPN